jgi:mannose-1-phosphate guanylyltransferase
MRCSRETWAVVLAAGDGTRLATLTTGTDGLTVPKQFCSLNGGPSLLAEAITRARRIVPRRRVCVVVADKHRGYWQRSSRCIPSDNVFYQPANRGTAHGVLLAVLKVLDRNPSARIAFLPADHHVINESALHDVLRSMASRNTDGSAIGVVGIEPDSPDPELGYIVPGAHMPNGLQAVERFIEKPKLAVAQQLVAAGALWNSFIFAADGEALLNLLQSRMSDSVHQMRRTLRQESTWSALVRTYHQLESIDLSQAIMQSIADSLHVVRAPRCGWTDLGTPQRVAAALHQLDQLDQGVHLEQRTSRCNSTTAHLNLAAQHALLCARPA